MTRDGAVDDGGRPPRYRRRPATHDADGFPEVPKHRQRTWEGLRWPERRAVVRAARRGQSHPDPAIARAARVWAKAVLTPRPRTRGRLETLLLLVEDPFGGTLGTMFAERRAARRVLAVKPPPAATSDG